MTPLDGYLRSTNKDIERVGSNLQGQCNSKHFPTLILDLVSPGAYMNKLGKLATTIIPQEKSIHYVIKLTRKPPNVHILATFSV